MKRFIQFFSFIAVALAVSAFSVNAQSGVSAQAEIPFDFSVNGTNLAAGSYEIRLVKYQTGAARILFNNEAGETVYSALVRTSGDAVGDQPRLIFDVNGGSRTLATLVTHESGYSLPKSKRSRSVTVRASIPLSVSDRN